MDAEHAQALHDLVHAQPVAALGTLHGDEPFVSMVPFACLPDGSALIIHVSTLAAHTRDMQATPQVSLLVIAPPTAGVMPQALARVTIQGRAERVAADSVEYAAAKAAYLARFADSEPLFGFADFSLFAIRPSSARYIGGFAQARTLSAMRLVEILRRS